MDARNIKFECNFVIKCNKKRGSMKIDVSKLFGIHAGMHCGFRFGNQNGRGIRN